MAKNSKRKQSEAQKKRYGAYAFGVEEKNRLKRLTRHVKKFPLDLVAMLTLEKFKKKGVPHRRKNRTVGMRLSESMQRILEHKGKRLSRAKIKTIKLVNNPPKHSPEGAMDFNKLLLVLNRHIRVKYKTSMQYAMEKAKEVQRNEAQFTT